jgi:hypothetical protein
MDFRVVIVTRDSARWIRIIATAYKRLGIRPLYLVHDKSSDATAEILRNLSEDVRIISIPHDRVESALVQFPDFVTEEWALRMDDDELPSRRLIAYTKGAIHSVKEEAIGHARREALPNVSPLSYPTMEVLFTSPLKPFHIDLQVRMFRPREVAYKDEIHTPGFTLRSLHVAPIDAYIVHFNQLVRSLPARLTKLAKYEKQVAGAGTLKTAYASVSELLPIEQLRARIFETREFDEIAEELRAIEHPEVTEKIEPEFEERLRIFLSSRQPADHSEMMLAALRDRIDAVPKPIRAFLKLI